MNYKSLFAPAVLCLAACIPCAAAEVLIKNKSGQVVYVVVNPNQEAKMKKGSGSMTPVDKNRSTITLFADEEITVDTTARQLLGGKSWLTIEKGGQSTEIEYVGSRWAARSGAKVPTQISAKVVEVK